MPIFKFSGFRILNPQDMGILLVNHKKAEYGDTPQTTPRNVVSAALPSRYQLFIVFYNYTLLTVLVKIEFLISM